MKPRFRAEWVVVREELLILASCLLRPMTRNSVLEEFRVRRFAGCPNGSFPSAVPEQNAPEQLAQVILQAKGLKSVHLSGCFPKIFSN